MSPIRFFTLGLLSFALIFFNNSAAELQFFETKVVEIAGQEFSVEIAKTYEQRQKGLMYRESLPADRAMLFFFPVKGNHRIWMKNTLIPLTVVWLDHTATVLDVKQLEPCYADPCASYGAGSPSNYVLEFSEGYTKLKAGDRVPGILNLNFQ